MLKAKGPLLLASNHPNSFLDGIILTILFQQNIYTLARGDAFRNKKHERLLRWLHLLPVYRTSEGVENLEHNYTTFAACQQAFAERAIVLIFSEGRCINEWHLRPLKKGTARLAVSSWQKGIDLTVVPMAFNYNQFRNFGKNVFINFGESLNKTTVLQHMSDGKLFSSFNELLQQQLEQLVYEIDADDIQKQKEMLYVHQPVVKKILLAIPAFAGWIAHAPLFYTGKTITKKYFDNDHFDSALASMLFLAYPLYLLLICIIAGFLISWIAAAVVFVFMPFVAWACVQFKPQM